MRRTAVIALIAAGCGSAPAEPPPPATPDPAAPVIPIASVHTPSPSPASTDAASAEKPATLPKLETSEDWKAAREGKCFGYSESRKETACLELKSFPRGHLEFVNLDLVLKDDQLNEVRRLQIHKNGRWSNGKPDLEQLPLDQKKVSAANTLLKDGGFVAREQPAN